MSMNGEYLRVTDAELERAIDDSGWAFEYVEEVWDKEDEAGLTPAAARCFATHKSWDLLGFLLRRAGFPVDVIHGEEPFADDADWGYGPPKYLSANRVQLAANALRDTSYDQLIAGVDPADLTRDEVYPQMWDAPAALESGRGWFEGLQDYFQAAAQDGDSVIVWLD